MSNWNDRYAARPGFRMRGLRLLGITIGAGELAYIAGVAMASVSAVAVVGLAFLVGAVFGLLMGFGLDRHGKDPDVAEGPPRTAREQRLAADAPAWVTFTTVAVLVVLALACLAVSGITLPTPSAVPAMLPRW